MTDRSAHRCGETTYATCPSCAREVPILIVPIVNDFVPREVAVSHVCRKWVGHSVPPLLEPRRCDFEFMAEGQAKRFAEMLDGLEAA